jgi:hypothetical protein
MRLIQNCFMLEIAEFDACCLLHSLFLGCFNNSDMLVQFDSSELMSHLFLKKQSNSHPLFNAFPYNPLALLKFNHHYDPEVEISYDEQGNCIAYTTRDVSAGSELRISYGFVTNPSALFGEFGKILSLFHV